MLYLLEVGLEPKLTKNESNLLSKTLAPKSCDELVNLGINFEDEGGVEKLRSLCFDPCWLGSSVAIKKLWFVTLDSGLCIIPSP